MGKKLLTPVRFIGHLAVLTITSVALWGKFNPWFYTKEFIGGDTMQFVNYVFYYAKHLGWPQNTWDYQWFNGFPRVLNMTFLHFYLIQPLVNWLGPWLAIKIYPFIAILLLVIFTYLTLYSLSSSILVSAGLILAVILSKGLYYPLFKEGLVLSSISQFAFPATLFFLVLFYKTSNKKNLLIASLMLALGFYSHGGNMMFFGFIPCVLFLIFSNHEGQRIITKESIKNTILFSLTTLLVAAFGTWPQIKAALGSSSYGTVIFTGLGLKPDVLGKLWINTSLGIFVISGLSFLSSLFLLKFKNINRLAIPALIVLIYFLAWSLTYLLGINPLAKFLYMDRLVWFFPLALAFFSAALLNGAKLPIKILTLMVGIISAFPLFSSIKLSDLRPYAYDVQKDVAKNLGSIASFIDPSDLEESNFRLWTHILEVNTAWGIVHSQPLEEGYFRYFSDEAEPWQGWFYGTIYKSNWEKEEIPHQMAQNHARFLLDWYAIKYFVGQPGSTINDLAPYFYEDTNLIIKRDISNETSLFEISPDYVSPIVEPSNSPVVGFVGEKVGWEYFLKAIASLRLNTKQIVPVKISGTVSTLCRKDLSNIDLVVLYGFSKKGLKDSCGWNKLASYVKSGGKVWIETGGNSFLQSTADLPAVFPVKSNSFKSLGKEWQVSGDMTSAVTFSGLEPLVYRGEPWKLSYSETDAVKTGAQILLAQNGKPIVVEQKTNQGTVVWSGANFWYRQDEYRQNFTNELAPIKFLLDRLLVNMNKGNSQVTVVRPKPERVEISGQNFSGVILKENYSKGWVAQLITGSKCLKLSVYSAGPGMMYIMVPKGLENGKIAILVTYRGELFHWLALIVAILSLFVTLDIILGSRIIKLLKISGVVKGIGGRFMSIGHWWGDDEE